MNQRQWGRLITLSPTPRRPVPHNIAV